MAPYNFSTRNIIITPIQPWLLDLPDDETRRAAIDAIFNIYDRLESLFNRLDDTNKRLSSYTPTRVSLVHFETEGAFSFRFEMVRSVMVLIQGWHDETVPPDPDYFANSDVIIARRRGKDRCFYAKAKQGGTTAAALGVQELEGVSPVSPSEIAPSMAAITLEAVRPTADWQLGLVPFVARHFKISFEPSQARILRVISRLIRLMAISPRVDRQIRRVAPFVDAFLNTELYVTAYSSTALVKLHLRFLAVRNLSKGERGLRLILAIILEMAAKKEADGTGSKPDLLVTGEADTVRSMQACGALAQGAGRLFLLKVLTGEERYLHRMPLFAAHWDWANETLSADAGRRFAAARKNLMANLRVELVAADHPLDAEARDSLER